MFHYLIFFQVGYLYSLVLVCIHSDNRTLILVETTILPRLSSHFPFQPTPPSTLPFFSLSPFLFICVFSFCSGGYGSKDSQGPLLSVCLALLLSLFLCLFIAPLHSTFPPLRFPACFRFVLPFPFPFFHYPYSFYHFLSSFTLTLNNGSPFK